MKHKGCTNEYEQERTEELLHNYRQLIAASTTIVLSQILDKLVNMQASRFWVSEERAAIVISRMLKGDTLQTMRPTTREMYTELFRRFQTVRSQQPNLTIEKAAFIAIRQPAPKFYLTPESARTIIHHAKKKAYQERMKKLRHMFNSGGT